MNHFDNPKKVQHHPAGPGGVQRLYSFPNGFGASVIQSMYSYGGREGFWELAVLDSAGRLTYDTPITSDVEGWLTEQAVDDLLTRIAELPKDTP